MSMKIKTAIVVGLERLCEITGHHWCMTLARKSAELDDKWGTSAWTAVGE